MSLLFVRVEPDICGATRRRFVALVACALCGKNMVIFLRSIAQKFVTLFLAQSVPLAVGRPHVCVAAQHWPLMRARVWRHLFLKAHQLAVVVHSSGQLDGEKEEIINGSEWSCLLLGSSSSCSGVLPAWPAFS